MCEFCLFLCGSVQVGAVVGSPSVSHTQDHLTSKCRVNIIHKAVPNISVAVKEILIFKISTIAELTVPT